VLGGERLRYTVPCICRGGFRACRKI